MGIKKHKTRYLTGCQKGCQKTLYKYIFLTLEGAVRYQSSVYVNGRRLIRMPEKKIDKRLDNLH